MSYLWFIVNFPEYFLLCLVHSRLSLLIFCWFILFFAHQVQSMISFIVHSSGHWGFPPRNNPVCFGFLSLALLAYLYFISYIVVGLVSPFGSSFSVQLIAPSIKPIECFPILLMPLTWFTSWFLCFLLNLFMFVSSDISKSIFVELVGLKYLLFHLHSISRQFSQTLNRLHYWIINFSHLLEVVRFLVGCRQN